MQVPKDNIVTLLGSRKAGCKRNCPKKEIFLNIKQAQLKRLGANAVAITSPPSASIMIMWKAEHKMILTSGLISVTARRLKAIVVQPYVLVKDAHPIETGKEVAW